MGAGLGCICVPEKNCLETQKLWNENECPSTPAVSGELQSGPRLSTPNSNSNTSLQPPKRTTTSSVSKWLARVSSKSSPTGLVARYTQFLENKKRSSFPLQYCNGNGLQLWQILQKIDKIWGCFKCLVDVPFVPRCSRLSNNNRQAQPTPRNFQPPLMVPENPNIKATSSSCNTSSKDFVRYQISPLKKANFLFRSLQEIFPWKYLQRLVKSTIW